MGDNLAATPVERCLACKADAVGTVERCLACEADAVGIVERCLACEADAVGTVERCLACEADAVGTVERCLACEAEVSKGNRVAVLNSICALCRGLILWISTEGRSGHLYI
jgi:hypothetical protein